VLAVPVPFEKRKSGRGVGGLLKEDSFEDTRAILFIITSQIVLSNKKVSTRVGDSCFFKIEEYN
jgi:hypothetical protein